MEQQYNQQSAKKLRRWAWIALGIACVLPLLTLLKSDRLAFQAGQQLSYLLFGVGFIAFITSIVFKKNTDEVKAKISLTVGILAVLYSGFTSMKWISEVDDVRASTENYAKAFQDTPVQTSVATTENAIQPQKQAEPIKVADSFKAPIARMLDEIAPIKKEQIARLTAMGQKASEINTSGVLHPDNLVTAQGISNSKKELKKFANIVAERESIYSDYVSKVMKVMDTVGLSADEKRDALAGFNENWIPQKKVLEDLSKAQRTVINSSLKIINLCEANLGKFQAQNGQILFQTQEQLTHYQTEMAKIQKAAVDEEKATNTYQQMSEQSAKRLEKNIQKFQN